MAFALSGSTITQSGTDTSLSGLSGITGVTTTNNGIYTFYRFDSTILEFRINGNLTINYNETIDNIGGAACNIFFGPNSTLLVNGNISGANNSPTQTKLLHLWKNTNTGLSNTNSSTGSPMLLEVRNATIALGNGFYFGNDGTSNGQIKTSGDVATILNAFGAGTNQGRLRPSSPNFTFNFTATKTYVGMWLNFGYQQTSLKGFTPINTDGPEINATISGLTVANRVDIEDYDTTFIVANFYPGTQIVLYGGHYCRLINNKLGTNIVLANKSPTSSDATAYNIIEFAKKISPKVQDLTANLITNALVYIKPIGTLPTPVHPRSGTNTSYSLNTISGTTGAGGTLSTPLFFIFAQAQANVESNISTYNYFCSGTTQGSETHQVWSSKYGYNKIAQSVLLSGNGEVSPIFSHSILPVVSTSAVAGAMTGISLDFTTKTATITSANSIQNVYDYYQYQLQQTNQLFTADDTSISGNIINWGTWSFIGIEFLNNSGNLKYLQTTGTITGNGSISNLSIIGNVSQATATNLTNVNISGTLTHNDNTSKEIVLSNTQIGTATNSGTGIITNKLTNDSTITTLATNELKYTPVSFSFTLNGGNMMVKNPDNSVLGYYSTNGTISFTNTSQQGTYTYIEKKRGFKIITGSFIVNTTTGENIASLTTLHIADNNVTDTTTDFTIADIQVAQNAYNLIDQYNATNNGLLTPISGVTIATIGIGIQQIDFGAYNLTQNTAFSFASNTITIKSTTFTQDTWQSTGNYTQGVATLTDSVRIRFANLDSEFILQSINPLKIYPTSLDRDSNTNLSITITTNVYRYLYGETILGSTLSDTLYTRATSGTTTLLSDFQIVIGNTIIPLDSLSLAKSTLSIVQNIDGNLQKVNRNVIKSSKLIPAGETF